MQTCNAIYFTGDGKDHIHCTFPRGHIGHHHSDYPGGWAEWLDSWGTITITGLDMVSCDGCSYPPEDKIICEFCDYNPANRRASELGSFSNKGGKNV